jgi:minor extracellular serine protease Vpr
MARSNLASFVRAPHAVRACAALMLAAALCASGAHAMNLVRQEARIDTTVSIFGVTGKNVIVAIMDRGVDWQNNDFRNADGTTRIAAIFDLTDDTGAGAASNPYGVGTIYERATIDSALRGQIAPLVTRDAVGHGTATAGIAAGNGRNSTAGKYRGVAVNATILAVKVTSDGAPAHDGQPAEAPYYNYARIFTAIDFVRDRAAALGKPCVMLLNLGSLGGPTDGTSDLCQKIDSTVGTGIPGLVFVSGAGDDGNMPNHAAGTVAASSTETFQFQKGNTGTLVVQLWYGDADRFDVIVNTPDASYGPYTSPPANADYDSDVQPEMVYYHYGSDTDSYSATSAKRFVYFDFSNGPTGTYSIGLYGATVSNGHFDASVAPSQFWNGADDLNQFLDHFDGKSSIWDGASAQYDICPIDYIVRTSWTDIDGFSRSLTGQGNLHDLWLGSSRGPTYDGRLGVDVGSPGDRIMTTYAPLSYWHTFRFNLVNDGGGFYGTAGGVSGAAPIVTGIVALMLEKNPHLDAAQVKQILQQSARRDSYTALSGALPNAIWGYGKVDAFGALQRVLQTTDAAAAVRPVVLSLASVGANPFISEATLEYALPRAGEVSLEVFDLQGRACASLASGTRAAGVYRASWRPAGLAPGVYFARLRVNGAQATTRLLHLR